jgi:hypothetical protein
MILDKYRHTRELLAEIKNWGKGNGITIPKESMEWIQYQIGWAEQEIFGTDVNVVVNTGYTDEDKLVNSLLKALGKRLQNDPNRI